MRLGYLGLDMLEMQFAVKERGRSMGCPIKSHDALLKRAARFSWTASRAVWRIGRQGMVKSVVCWTDTDRAGCQLTRKCTSALVARPRTFIVDFMCDSDPDRTFVFMSVETELWT